MKNKLRFLAALALTIVAVVHAGCKKEQEETVNNYQATLTKSVPSDTSIVQYAISLASVLENVECRNIVKTEAQKKFDGDYDILADTLQNKTIESENQSFQTLLANNLEKQGIKDGVQFLKNINTAIPNLQISVPIKCDEWDTESFIPKVVPVPISFDDSKNSFITGYDCYGNAYTFSLDEDPEEPVIVVGISERIDEDGNKRFPEQEHYDYSVLNNSKSAPNTPSGLSLVHGPARCLELSWTDLPNENQYLVYRRYSDEYNYSQIATTTSNHNYYIDQNMRSGKKASYKVRAKNSDGMSAYSSENIATTVSDRGNGELLKIRRMKFNTSSALREVESWIRGAPELRLRVYAGNSSTPYYTSGVLEPNRRADINETWWNHEVTIFPSPNGWDTNSYGTVLTFDWKEEDNQFDQEYTVSTSYEDKYDHGTIKVGVTAKFNSSASGDVGNGMVLWWHNKSTTYDSRDFLWEFVQ